MDVVIAKAGNGYFRILYSDDFDKLNELAIGEEVNAKITKPRNLRFHRKFFALLAIVEDNLPEHLEKLYHNKEMMLTELKIELGYYKIHTTFDGRSFQIPLSIAFDKMDELEFRKFYNRAVNAVVKIFLPGADPDGIISHIFENF